MADEAVLITAYVIRMDGVTDIRVDQHEDEEGKIVLKQDDDMIYVTKSAAKLLVEALGKLIA